MVLKFSSEKELEQKFREAAMKRYGYRKGSLQKAAREALANWIMQHSGGMPIESDPFKLVKGILNVKGRKTSVELQHEARQLWVKRSS